MKMTDVLNAISTAILGDKTANVIRHYDEQFESKNNGAFVTELERAVGVKGLIQAELINQAVGEGNGMFSVDLLERSAARLDKAARDLTEEVGSVTLGNNAGESVAQRARKDEKPFTPTKKRGSISSEESLTSLDSSEHSDSKAGKGVAQMAQSSPGEKGGEYGKEVGEEYVKEGKGFQIEGVVVDYDAPNPLAPTKRGSGSSVESSEYKDYIPPPKSPVIEKPKYEDIKPRDRKPLEEESASKVAAVNKPSPFKAPRLSNEARKELLGVSEALQSTGAKHQRDGDSPDTVTKSGSFVDLVKGKTTEIAVQSGGVVPGR